VDAKPGGFIQHNSGISAFTAKADDWMIVYQALKPENLPEPGRKKSSGKKAANILNGSFLLARALTASF